MRDEARRKRHEAITAAAYALLEERGYAGTSMLTIARAAKASNETLYRWYGDKQGLFAEMVRDNAEASRALLDEAIADEGDPLEALARLGPVLFGMVLGDRAVLLNRAAAADASGELGAAISAGGREAVRPLLVDLMRRVAGDDAAEGLVEVYLSLLIGDLQIRRAIGAMPAPDQATIDARAERAMTAFLKLLND
ncbi:TetR/AcrR family transcriptional regulator [Amaricoccus tamworthensis]|uniref:TetR/AcrR family transcriptional regulator n=1 Tax=Amaricoccus tamworthensis TaxID=57002 RepID=UPI003C7E1443